MGMSSVVAVVPGEGAAPEAVAATLRVLESLDVDLRFTFPPVGEPAEVTALFAHAVGLLVLSHTGRIRMFKQGSQALFETYLQQLLARAAMAGKG